MLSDSPLQSIIIAKYLAGIVAQYQLCSGLPPNVIFGKTRVVLIYWPHVDRDPPNFQYDFNQNPATDAIWVIP